MARFSRTPVSRTVISVVVIAIAIGAIFQFNRVKKSAAVTPPLQMSVAPLGQAVTPAPVGTVAKPSGLVVTPPAVKTLITQTPDINHPAPTPDVPVNAKQASQVLPPSAVKESAKPVSQTPVASDSVISDAAAKVTAGDLIAARTELNTALLSGQLSAADTDAVKKQMAQINQTLVFSPRQFSRDPLGGVYQVQSGDRLKSIGNAHAIPYELLLSLNRMTDARKLRYGQALKVINGPFHAVVTKSKFTLDVYLGSPGGSDSTYITTFMVGLGTDNSTPTGTWTIKNKVPGPAYFPPQNHPGPVIAPGDPKNPLGAYWMGLEGTGGQAVGQQSYGIHGTIDPDSIGKQSSMGCIRLRNEDVEVLFKMLVPEKSSVIVRD